MAEAVTPARDGPSARRAVRLFRPYRLGVAGLVGLIVAAAILGIVPAFLLRDLLDNVLAQGADLDTTRLNWLIAGLIAIPIATGAIGVYQTWLANRIGQAVMHDLRVAVYSHLQKLSLAFFTRTRTGELQSRIANDIGGIQSVVTSTATSVASNVTIVVATTVAMAILDWRLTLATLATLPLFVWMTRRVGNRRRAITKERQSSLADMSSLVEESLSVPGVLLAKTMGQSSELTDRFAGESRRLASLEIRQRMTGRWSMAAVQTSFAVMPAITYLLAGYGMASGVSEVSIGTLVAFTALQTRLLFPVGSLLSVSVELQTSMALFDRIFAALDEPITIEEPTSPQALPGGASRGELRFDRVGFRYSGASAGIEDVSFVARSGSTVAIVGATGSGKTTLGYLAARLYDPTEGAVRLDGVDLRDLSFDDLAGSIGVISQDTYLFHGSVRDNLRFARPDATDAEIEQAGRAAQIHELIVSLPHGYDTTVGERGYRFSGGERQRLSIARAILRNPPVLVLDEATSALDVTTEHEVQRALAGLEQGRTSIVIAHRLSTVRDADEILLLEAGRIVERGTYDELVSLGARFAAMVNRSEGQLVEI